MFTVEKLLVVMSLDLVYIITYKILIQSLFFHILSFTNGPKDEIRCIMIDV